MQLTMRQTKKAKSFITHFLLGLWALVCLAPIYWVLITSFKLPIAVFQGPK